MTTKQSITARLLGTQKTAAELRQGVAEIYRRQQEVNARLQDISENKDCSGLPGPVRAAALQAGDTAAIVELNREQAELLAERETLNFQDAALYAEIEQADKREALAALPRMIKGFPDRLAEFRKAQAAFRAARQSLDDAVSGIVEARKLDDVTTAPGLPLDQALAVADIRGLTDSGREGFFNGARVNLAMELAGVDIKPKGETRSERRAKATPEPRASFWDRREPGEPRQA